MKNQQFYVKTARLAVPIMMQNMITIGVNMADNIMVGSLGENALSAVALAIQLYGTWTGCIDYDIQILGNEK